MPEMSGKCKSNPTKTNNLIYILKITQKMRKQTQKRGNLSTNWEFETFFENRKRTQKTGNGSKKRGNGPKKRGNKPKKSRKPINKLRIWNFFWKPETDPKNEETDWNFDLSKFPRVRFYTFFSHFWCCNYFLEYKTKSDDYPAGFLEFFIFTFYFHSFHEWWKNSRFW